MKFAFTSGLGFRISFLRAIAFDFGQNFVRLRPVSLLTRARPNGLSFKTSSPRFHAAEHHRTEPTVAERRRFSEICGGGIEPNRVSAEREDWRPGEWRPQEVEAPLLITRVHRIYFITQPNSWKQRSASTSGAPARPSKAIFGSMKVVPANGHSTEHMDNWPLPANSSSSADSANRGFFVGDAPVRQQSETNRKFRLHVRKAGSRGESITRTRN